MPTTPIIADPLEALRRLPTAVQVATHATRRFAPIVAGEPGDTWIVADVYDQDLAQDLVAVLTRLPQLMADIAMLCPEFPDQKRLNEFAEHVSRSGSPAFTAEENAHVRAHWCLFDGDYADELLERALLDPRERHPVACAYRIAHALRSLSPAGAQAQPPTAAA